MTMIPQPTHDGRRTGLLEPPESPVRSYNEWDPLEEVIVGVFDGTAVPEWDVAVAATMPARSEEYFRRHAGGTFPEEYTRLAGQELDHFASVLTEAGVQVVRPTPITHCRPFTTPNWRSPGGLYSAMPTRTGDLFGQMSKCI